MGTVYKFNTNTCKYTKYEQFGIVVIDFLDQDIIDCYTREAGNILLYKKKKHNCSKKLFPNGYLGKYKTLYYKLSYQIDGILISTSCFCIN